MWHLPHDIFEGAPIHATIVLHQLFDVDTVAADDDTIGAAELLAIFEPGERRLRRGCGLAEQIHGIAFFLDKEARWNLAQDWTGCKDTTY